ncbi:MAG: cupin domain-containing protein [Solirubrobacteraceae bacterium]
MDTINTPTPRLSHLPEPVWYGNSLFEFLVPAEASDGTISIFRSTLAAGFSPPRHVHTREDEVFMVEAGDVRFWIDGRELAAAPGTTVYMPRGVPHTFRVDSDGAVILGVMTPGTFASLFPELGVPAPERTLPPPGAVPFDVARVMAAQEERGTRVVGPPLAPAGNSALPAAIER